MVKKATKVAVRSAFARQFTTAGGMTSSGASDSESEVRPKLDPRRKQVTDFLRNTSQFENQVKDVLQPYYFKSDKLKGFATEAGTDAFYRRSQYEDINLEVHPMNFKNPFESAGLKMSSIGVGTYMGEPDDMTDYLMYDGIKTAALSGGVNVFDTAPNYRYTKSERTLGRALTTLDNKYGITRDQVFIQTKGGYIPEDAERMISKTDETQRMIQKLGVPEEEIVKETGHCIHPKFLKDQLESSLTRLNVEAVDVYYLQNAYESQGPYNTDNVFFDRLTAAFEFLESQVQAGKLKHYGLATYSCFRTKPSESKVHLSLEKVVRIAEKVGGKNHSMNYIQVPINVLMPEAFVEPWQRVEDEQKIVRNKILLPACNDLGINVISTQPLLQGYLANMPLSRAHMSVFNIPARHLQLIRSIPGRALKSTMVGMKQMENVRGNLEVIRKPLMTREEFFDTLKPHRRQEYIEEELDM